MTTRIIAVVNHKGGVGKTTVSVNLACGIARWGGKVLLIDVDPQANATSTILGTDFAQGKRIQTNNPLTTPCVDNVLRQQVGVSEAIYARDLPPQAPYNENNVDVHMLPAHIDMVILETFLYSEFRREYRLRDALASIQGNYDFIIIDCPPSLGVLTINALMAANEILIPVDVGTLAQEGINLLLETIAKISPANPDLTILGTILAAKDHTIIAGASEENLAKYGYRVFPSIPSLTAIREAIAVKTDIFDYQPEGKAASAYWTVVNEVVHGE